MRKFNITVNGNMYEVEVEEITDGAVSSAHVVNSESVKKEVKPVPVSNGKAGSIKVESPMPGTVLKINVKVGDKVKKGDTVVVLEAMKMENEIAAPNDGAVASINVAQGSSVETGTLLITLN